MTDIKFLFHCDVSDLVEGINKLSNEKWHEFTLRQRIFKEHEHTLTIPFKWSLLAELDYNSELFDAEYNYNLFPIELLEPINKISNELREYWGGEVLNCILLKLLAGKSIPRHSDGGNVLGTSKRCHLALITHPDVSFTVGETTMHMAAGDWYLINNMTFHAVDNNSMIDRVHLVIDVGNTQ
jgi:hypothetical protein